MSLRSSCTPRVPPLFDFKSRLTIDASLRCYPVFGAALPPRLRILWRGLSLASAGPSSSSKKGTPQRPRPAPRCGPANAPRVGARQYTRYEGLHLGLDEPQIETPEVFISAWLNVGLRPRRSSSRPGRRVRRGRRTARLKLSIRSAPYTSLNSAGRSSSACFTFS